MNYFKALILLISVFMFACSDSKGTAGATSETTNGIAVIVVDRQKAPIPSARVKLFFKDDMSVVEEKVANDSGKVMLETEDEALIEIIAGADSALMYWGNFNNSTQEVQVDSAASLNIRTASDGESDKLFAELFLDSTPYSAILKNGNYDFGKVPQGVFTLKSSAYPISEIELSAGEVQDTLIHVPEISKEFVFEDFDDGDSLNNLAKVSPNYGWYLLSTSGVVWNKPDSSKSFAGALTKNGNGFYLDLKYDLGDSGTILVGTHLGADSAYFDLSKVTAIRLKIKGDAEFSIALEHKDEIGDNNYKKASWTVKAQDSWKEIVLYPGTELVDEASYNVSFDSISKEIALFSLFIHSGTALAIDEIVFEGIDNLQ